MTQIKIVKLLFLFIFTCDLSSILSSNFYFVIMAGGSGKRLWPLSRKHRPKQFIDFIDNKTLLDLTIDRATKVVDRENIWAVTTEQYKSLVDQYFKNYKNNIIIEPSSRNTGPAILLTCLELYKIDPQAVICFLPADHYIEQEDMFVDTIKNAMDHAQKSEDIVLLGINPTFASTEYGYIEFESVRNLNNIHKVSKFHEKPSKDLAADYIKSGKMLWNCGIFCAKVSTFLNEFKTCSPKLSEKLEQYTLGKTSYDLIEDMPFDIAVLEKTKHCVVIPSFFNWSDVGSLENFLSIKKSKSKNNILKFNSSDNLVDLKNNKFTVLLGVKNLFVLETEDLLFVCDKNYKGDIKKILEELDKNYNQYV